MKRRTFLKKSSALLALIGSAGLPGMTLAEDVRVPLTVPKLLENLDKSGDTAIFAMDVRQGSVDLFPGKRTATLGYNGDFLGPTIRVRKDQLFKFSLHNSLPEITTLHWHGLHLPAKWDGGPRQPISPGTDWKPEFFIRQEAATLWYHPHAMGLTGKQVYHGLSGLFLIEDDKSDKLDLPKTYGVDDIPLIIQDRRFFSNGQFAYVQSMHDVINGVIGNYLLINGAVQPVLKVHSGLVRLRLLNGSNSSIYRIAFGEKRSFQVIASDGGFLEHPVTLDSILLSTGERAEVLVDFSKLTPGSETGLWVEQIGGGRFEAMNIVINRPSETKVVVPAQLRKFEKLSETKANHVRQFVMETMSMGGGGMGMMGGRLSINGKQMDINRIDEQVKAGTIEIWEITNRSGMMMTMPHSMHLHDVQFQILSRDGQLPLPHEQGRKDTVLILPGETVRIIIPFNNEKGVYMYHCHLLEHEDDGMMGQFEII